MTSLSRGEKRQVHRFLNTFLITLEPYAKNIPYDIVIRDLRQLGFNQIEIIYELSREGEIALRLPNTDLITFSRYARLLDYISHIFELVYVLHETSSIDLLKDLSRRLLEEVRSKYNVSTFRVTVKRIDKEFPLTSIELAREVGAELCKVCKVDLDNPDVQIYVEVRREFILIGYTLSEVARKVRECVPNELLDNITVIVDDPRTVYELMDLIQLSRALRLRLRIFDRTGRAASQIRRACAKLGLSTIPDTVSICTDAASCLQNCHVIVVLSQYARFGEKLLLEISSEILKRGYTLCLVVGNEVEDPGIDLRDRAHYEVRLGPCTGQAMRTVNAITYALGVIVTSFHHARR